MTYTHAQIFETLKRIYSAASEAQKEVICNEAIKYDIFVWELEPSQTVSRGNDLQRHESIRRSRSNAVHRSLTIED